MLTSVLTVVSLLVVGVFAQESPNFPPGFDSSAIEQDRRNSWCNGQTNTCPDICGGFAQQNRCDPTRLTFDCVCPNGTSPDVGQYMNTLPFYICQANYGQCIENSPDLEGERKCKEAKKGCGKLNATEANEPETTTTAAAPPAKTSGSTTMKQTPSTTGENPSATSDNFAVSIQMAQNYSLGVLAAAFFAVFGFFL